MKAIAAGLCFVVVGLSLLMAGVLSKSIGASALYLSWGIVSAGAAITAYIAAQKKFLHGVLLSIPTSIAVGFANFCFNWAGYQSDFNGLWGALVLIAVLLPFAAFACALGSVIGVRLFQLKTPTDPMTE